MTTPNLPLAGSILANKPSQKLFSNMSTEELSMAFDAVITERTEGPMMFSMSPAYAPGPLASQSIDENLAKRLLPEINIVFLLRHRT